METIVNFQSLPKKQQQLIEAATDLFHGHAAHAVPAEKLCRGFNKLLLFFGQGLEVDDGFHFFYDFLYFIHKA